MPAGQAALNWEVVEHATDESAAVAFARAGAMVREAIIGERGSAVDRYLGPGSLCWKK